MGDIWNKMSDAMGMTPYMATAMENQNNALAAGADNSINDPNWNKNQIKKGIQVSKPKKKIKVSKSYPE
jgi:hypothetical protein